MIMNRSLSSTTAWSSTLPRCTARLALVALDCGPFHDAVKHTARSAASRPALVELDCQLFTMRARPFPNEFIILCSMHLRLNLTLAQRVPYLHLARPSTMSASILQAASPSAWLENRSCCSRRALQYPSFTRSASTHVAIHCVFITQAASLGRVAGKQDQGRTTDEHLVSSYHAC
jgi:hypothetical protein